MTEPASSTLVERLNAAYEWIRRPDWEERFSYSNLVDWLNERPTGLQQEAAARITELEAELLRVKSYLSDAGWETVQSEQAWKARALAAESQLERVRAEMAILANGIQDCISGNFGPTLATKHDQCPHGRFGWEDCGNCIDEHLKNVLSAAAAPPQQKTENSA